jgi:hypothetical protein
MKMKKLYLQKQKFCNSNESQHTLTFDECQFALATESCGHDHRAMRFDAVGQIILFLSMHCSKSAARVSLLYPRKEVDCVFHPAYLVKQGRGLSPNGNRSHQGLHDWHRGRSRDTKIDACKAQALLEIHTVPTVHLQDCLVALKAIRKRIPTAK